VWSFTGDGLLTGAPIVVNQYVFIRSSSGNLYALDAATGQIAWTTTLPAAIGANVKGLPFASLAAGDGLLVVPSGNTVSAYILSTNP
jgi:outer membrane protein assembly factor BamB